MISTIFFSLALGIGTIMIGKIITNFATGEPGFAGFRVDPKFGSSEFSLTSVVL